MRVGLERQLTAALDVVGPVELDGQPRQHAAAQHGRALVEQLERLLEQADDLAVDDSRRQRDRAEADRRQRHPPARRRARALAARR